MDFYKLQMDRERNNDILAHYEDDFGIYLTEMVIGKRYEAGTDDSLSSMTSPRAVFHPIIWQMTKVGSSFPIN